MQSLAEGLPVAFQLWVFLVGAVVGSFLNVVIARVPKGESIVSPGSRCPNCKSAIAWYDNIPLLSWLWLRGKCRRCGQPISARYPMVELLVALLAVAVVRQFGPTLAAAGMFALAAALVALAYIDLDTWLLPHQITWPLLAVGLLSPLWNRSVSWASSAIGAAAGFAFFAAIALFGERVLKRETMGWGDVWLLSGIGAWLGWQALFPVVMLSALQGSIIGIVMLLVAPRAAEPEKEKENETEKENEQDEDWVPPKHAVPYGPFLALAALEQLLAGHRLVAAWDFLVRRLFG